MEKRRLVLASSSPRRRELLERAGLRFVVDPPEVDEDARRWPEASAATLVKNLAREKALAVLPRHPGAVILAADTVVVLGPHRWSKPASKKEARMMLQGLSGKRHDVWTGFCIGDTTTDRRVVRAVRTRLAIRMLTSREIERYLATGEPLDGAGGYKMQGTGGFIIDKVEGDYTNVLGLPLAAVLAELEKFGVRA